MNELGPKTPQDMIDAFLRAEEKSPIFGPLVAQVCHALGIPQRELFQPHNADNRARVLSAYRGGFLAGLPTDTTWRLVELANEDLPRLVYSNYPTWIELSGQTRRVVDGAANLHKITVTEGSDTINSRVVRVVDAIRRGEQFPELIAVEGHNDTVILVEGHTRATAHAYAVPELPLVLLLGRSPTMRRWARY
jgi:hypothetical protein